MSKKKEHTNKLRVEIKKDFYLYGLVPKSHKLIVDRELKKLGIGEVSDLKISRYKTLRDNLWTFFTFGLYVPETYVLKAKTLKK